MIKGRLGPCGIHEGTELKRDIKWLFLCQHTKEGIAKELRISLAIVEAVAVEIEKKDHWW